MSQLPINGISGTRVNNNDHNFDAGDSLSSIGSISRSKWGRESNKQQNASLATMGAPSLVLHANREEDLANIYSSSTMPVLQGPKQQQKMIGLKPQNKWNTNPASLMEGKSMYTMINEDHTWQRIGKVDAPTERPATRREILALHAFFDIAMDLSDRMVRKANSKLNTGATSSSSSEMEQDILGVKEDVRLLFDYDIKGKLSLDKTTHQSILAAAIFEHKWADVVFGQAIQQISVSCHEHGQLLRQVRKALAGCFAALQEVHKKTIRDIRGMSELAESYKGDLNVLRQEQKVFQGQLEQKKADEIQEIKEEAKLKYLEYDEQIKEADNANKRMNETLLTLNNIFRNMRDDADMVRSLDFLDTITKLEAQLNACFKELGVLRPLQQELANSKASGSKLRDKLDRKNSEIQSLKEEISQRDAMIQELIQKESERLSNWENKRVGSETVHVVSSVQVVSEQQPQQKTESTTVGEHNGATPTAPSDGGPRGTPVTAATIMHETDTPQVNDLDATKGPAATAASKIRQGMDPQSFVSATTMCSRCNKALDEAGNIDHLIEKQETSQKRLPCTGYRILLPNLMGYRPERPKHWVLRAMRSIIRSKQRSDLRDDRDGRNKLRFPEFVYAWFAPEPGSLDEVPKEGRLQVHAQADEHRWALYYGVKKLAPELPEAKLFYNLLDEKHGEDELSFYLHILTVTESVVQRLGEGALDWGVGCDCLSFAGLSEMYENENLKDEVCEFAWIQVKHAAEVVKLIMNASTPAEKQRTLKRLAECAIQQQSALFQPHDMANKMIDVHVCIHILLKDFHQEQAHRRAALRLMFGSLAAAGTEEHSVNRTVDLQQLTSMVESLNSRALSTDAVAMYRVAHELGKGKVDFESFMLAAERANFFSRCLRLPPHFGAESPSGMTPGQTAHLAEVVRKHAALLGSSIQDFCETFLTPVDAQKLRFLMGDLQIELSKGKLVLDGRRALCAIRRVLEYMLRRRLDYHELHGETVEPERVSNIVDRELSVLSSVVTNFESDEVKERLNYMKKKNSATVIQRKWRLKRENNPSMPTDVRHTLSTAFEPHALLAQVEEKRSKKDKFAPLEEEMALSSPKGDLEDVKLKKRVMRVVSRPLEWVLIWIDMIFRRKIQRDMCNSQRRWFLQTKGKVNRPPIPPRDDLTAPVTSGCSLVPIIHEVALSIYGVRSHAERAIHDFFINVHRLAKSHPRVRLFARFTGVRSHALRAQHLSLLEMEDDSNAAKLMIAEEPMLAELPEDLCSQGAIDTYSMALLLLYGANGCSGPLFLQPDEDGESFLTKESAELHVKALFKGAHGPSKHRPCGSPPCSRSAEEVFGCLERIEQGNKVEVDRFLLAVMQGWLVESRIRRQELKHLAKSLLSRRSSGSLEQKLTWSFFRKSVLPSLHSAPSDEGAMNLFRSLLKAKDPNEDIDMEAIARNSEFELRCQWTANPDLKGLSFPANYPGIEMYLKLLSYTWNPLKLSIGMEVHRLVALSKVDGEQGGDIDSNIGELREVQEAYMSTFDVLEKFFASVSKKPPQEVQITAAFEKVQSTLEKLHAARCAAGVQNEPFIDSLDLAVDVTAKKQAAVKDKKGGKSRRSTTKKTKKKK